MINQYRGGVIPESAGFAEIAETARKTSAAGLEFFNNFDFSRGLEAIWALIAVIDKFIVERAPWKLVKDPAAQTVLDETLYTAAETLRIVCIWLYPVMPDSAKKIWEQLGMTTTLESRRVADLDWGKLPAGQKIGKISGVFPRIEEKPAIEKMKELEIKEKARQDALLGKKPAEPVAGSSTIAIDDFAKVDLRVGVVVTAQRVKGSDKLLHLSVDIGEPQPRSIVAGIAEAYEPEPLVGRKVVIVANLAPRKLRGIESQGMIVAASLEGGKPVLASFLEDVPVGARLK
jgi:methionyl-tRNA synthetase